ncbi:MAG: CheY7 [Herbinix sp.]|jgi:hypothetical protein|nr:CheY7 [Herbinix sp.]
MERVILNRLREELKSLSVKEREEYAQELGIILAERPVARIETLAAEEEVSKEISIFEIKELLRKFGMPTNIKGYTFVADAINLCLTDPSSSAAWVKCIYIDVALKNDTTPSRAERAMRHAIEMVCNRARNDGLLYEIFEAEMDSEGGKVCNSRFVSGLVEYLKEKHSIQ